MIKTQIGTLPDGSPWFNYTLTEEERDAGYTINFATGNAIAGTVSLPDGTVYDVTEGAIPVRAEHVVPLQVAIHKAHHAAGRFLDIPVPDIADVAPNNPV